MSLQRKTWLHRRPWPLCYTLDERVVTKRRSLREACDRIGDMRNTGHGTPASPQEEPLAGLARSRIRIGVALGIAVFVLLVYASTYNSRTSARSRQEIAPGIAIELTRQGSRLTVSLENNSPNPINFDHPTYSQTIGCSVLDAQISVVVDGAMSTRKSELGPGKSFTSTYSIDGLASGYQLFPAVRDVSFYYHSGVSGVDNGTVRLDDRVMLW